MTQTQDAPVDSGMDAETVATAEWLWTNLPTGPRRWTGLPTHEKALVCHTVARFEAHIRSTSPATGLEGYRDAYYEIADLLDIPAQTLSPRKVFDTQIKPRIERLASDTEAMRLLLAEAREDVSEAMRAHQEHGNPDWAAESRDRLARIDAALAKGGAS